MDIATFTERRASGFKFSAAETKAVEKMAIFNVFKHLPNFPLTLFCTNKAGHVFAFRATGKNTEVIDIMLDDACTEWKVKRQELRVLSIEVKQTGELRIGELQTGELQIGELEDPADFKGDVIVEEWVEVIMKVVRKETKQSEEATTAEASDAEWTYMLSAHEGRPNTAKSIQGQPTRKCLEALAVAEKLLVAESDPPAKARPKNEMTSRSQYENVLDHGLGPQSTGSWTLDLRLNNRPHRIRYVHPYHVPGAHPPQQP